MSSRSKRNLKIFVSCDPKDRRVANAIADTLQQAFPFSLDITLSSDVPSNPELHQLIRDSIEATDVLVAVTSEASPNYGFTLYEIGLFDGSLARQPNIAFAPHLRRRLVPFAILSKIPAAINMFTGVELDFEAQSWNSILDERKEDSTSNRKIAHFLDSIQGMVSEAGERRFERDQVDRLKKLGVQLCEKLMLDIGDRVRAETSATTLVIQVQPGSGRIALDELNTATVRPQGYCYEASVSIKMFD